MAIEEERLPVVLRQAALQFLMAAGLTMVVLTGGIDLSVGAVLGLGACLGAGFIASGSVLLGVAAALGAGLACGLVNGALVAYVGIPAFIATYGMLWVAHGLGYVFMKGEVIHGFPAAFRTLGAGFVGGIPVLPSSRPVPVAQYHSSIATFDPVRYKAMQWREVGPRAARWRRVAELALPLARPVTVQSLILFLLHSRSSRSPLAGLHPRSAPPPDGSRTSRSAA